MEQCTGEAIFVSELLSYAAQPCTQQYSTPRQGASSQMVPIPTCAKALVVCSSLRLASARRMGRLRIET